MNIIIDSKLKIVWVEIFIGLGGKKVIITIVIS